VLAPATLQLYMLLGPDKFASPGILICIVAGILFLNQMKLTRSAKAGLVLLAIGLSIFLAVAIWLKTTRTTLVDIPMPMRAEVTRKDFSVDYDGPIYGMVARFDRSVSETTARCLLGATNSDLYPELDCSGIAPLLKFTWELRRDGQFGGSGSSANMGSVSKMDGALRVMIVGFPAQKNHRYQATLTFENNAMDLKIPPPIVQIELDSFVKEDLFILGAILDSLASVMCLVGVVLVTVSLLKKKFKSLTTLPEPS